MKYEMYYNDNGTDIQYTFKDTSKIHYSEWYYIEDGKIKLWNQTRRIILSK